MIPSNFLRKPKVSVPLDPEYQPIILFVQAYEDAIQATNEVVRVRLAVRRSNDQVATIDTLVFSAPEYKEDNYRYIERYVKTLLWLKGGYHILYAGPEELGMRLQTEYQKGGARSFDAEFMSNIYQRPFQIDIVSYEDVPKTDETSIPLGRHLDGCRIGFDAGGSDRKVSAVVDGVSMYSEEIVWHPKQESDPNYHYQGILDSIERAASKLPRVDAIGVSSAGIFIDDEVAAASLFRKVPQDRFDKEVRTIYKRIAKQMGDVPIKVANDGDVTALAGAMALDSNNVLGIAMGTSEAAGYVDKQGNITGWLNELAFVPVDLNPTAMADEWSMDTGVGVTYFSQDAVIKLAEYGNIPLDNELSPAQKLRVVQELVEENDPTAIEIFRTIGIYLGYSIAYYSRFYDITFLLILGRVTSGSGGEILVQQAKDILQSEFPSLANSITLTLPDEIVRRVGQSIAAASLPSL